MNEKPACLPFVGGRLVCLFSSHCYHGLLSLFAECEIKSQTSFGAVCHADSATMEQNGMLDDGKAKSSSTLLTGASLVYAIEAFKQVGQLLGAHTLAVILKAYATLLVGVFKKCDIYVFTFGIGNGILCQVAED